MKTLSNCILIRNPRVIEIFEVRGEQMFLFICFGKTVGFKSTLSVYGFANQFNS